MEKGPFYETPCRQSDSSFNRALTMRIFFELLHFFICAFLCIFCVIYNSTFCISCEMAC